MPQDEWDFGASEKKSSADLGQGKQGQVFEETVAQKVVGNTGARVLLGLGIVLAAAVVGLVLLIGSSSDDDSPSATVAEPRTTPFEPSVTERETPTRTSESRPAPTEREAPPPAQAPIIPVDDPQIKFVAEKWIEFAARGNLGAFCIFMTERLRRQLTRQENPGLSLAQCVQGNFPKFTLGRRLLPIRSIRKAGDSRAIVVYGNGRIARMVRDGGAWKIDGFR